MLSPLVLLPSRSLRALAVALVASSCLAAPTSQSGVRLRQGVIEHWAPGVLNPEGGTVELDVEFVRAADEMKHDWHFLLRATGNGPAGGTTLLGIVVCPPGDDRGFLALAKSDERSGAARTAIPGFPVGETRRVAMTWGEENVALWFDGERIAEDRFAGRLPTLPETFVAGRLGAFRVRALRVSDHPRGAAALRRRGELTADDRTTLLVTPTSTETPTTEWQREDLVASLFPERKAASLVTPAGRALRVPLRAVNYSDKEAVFRVSVGVRSRAGEPSAAPIERGLAIAPASRYTEEFVELPVIEEPGYHEATLHIVGPRGAEAEHKVAFVVQLPDAAPDGAFAGFLGHHHVFADKPDLYTQIGIRRERAWAANRAFLWCAVEPARGHFEWEAADRALEQAEALGVSTLGLLGYPPTWASTYSEEEYAKIAKKTVKAYSRRPERYQPRSLAEWTSYVRAVVTRYRGRVAHWEIYNEVDFHPPGLHATFSGSTKDYADLLAAASRVVREVDPAAKVLISGFSMVEPTDRSMPGQLLRSDAAEHFDIFNVHAYVSRETLAGVVGLARAARPKIPLWQTERQYMGGWRDDQEVIHSLFWCLGEGFETYFLHESDIDRDYGNLKITPLYAVTAEVARQLRVAETYAGPVPGVGNGCASWLLRRSDRSFLGVFSISHGRVRLTFKGGTPRDLVLTNLHGERLPVPAEGPVVLEGLVYAVSKTPLEVAALRREPGNMLANPGFEIRSGDFVMDEASARPTWWRLSPPAAPISALSFQKGRSGEFSVRLDNPSSADAINVNQDVAFEETGRFRLSAYVRVPAGEQARLRLFLVTPHGRWPSAHDARVISGTGEWQSLDFEGVVTRTGQGRAIIGIEPGSAPVEIDDVELSPVDGAETR